MLAVISDKGTVHVFSLGQGVGGGERNKQSSFTPYLGAVLPRYFSSRWGFGKAHVPVEGRGERFMVGWWGEGEGVVVVGREGGWWKFSVPRSGSGGEGGQEGECKEIGYKRYLNVGKDG
jgi:hypothetical protein